MELSECEKDGLVDAYRESDYAWMKIMLMCNRCCHALTLHKRKIKTSSGQYGSVQLWSYYTCKCCGGLQI